MIKTFNGNHETTVDPSMMQAALDQGIRPVGYNSPIDEIILTQSDPMKVIPPKDGEVICNSLGTAFMSAKTANELLSMQHTQCCSEKCKVFLDGSYRRGQVDAVEKVLKIIDGEIEETKKNEAADYNGTDYEFFEGYIDAADNIRMAVKNLLEKQQAVQMFEDMLEEQA